MSKHRTSEDNDTLLEEDIELKEPSLYRVLLLNDDYTHQHFVVEVLRDIFNKSIIEAEKIMLTVHHRGQGLCGLYPKEIAEVKVEQVHQRARSEGFPLRCVMEEV
jgi:ATP-dependent Clp protease adaptor protein ClpS